jgi:hypothetical protein
MGRATELRVASAEICRNLPISAGIVNRLVGYYNQQGGLILGRREMATKQIVIDLDPRLAGVVLAMAEEDCRTIPQQIAWLIRREAIRRNLLDNIAGETVGETRPDQAAIAYT